MPQSRLWQGRLARLYTPTDAKIIIISNIIYVIIIGNYDDKIADMSLKLTHGLTSVISRAI